MLPSIGLTVLVPENVASVSVRVTWGDYVTEPPLAGSYTTRRDTTRQDSQAELALQLAMRFS